MIKLFNVSESHISFKAMQDHHKFILMPDSMTPANKQQFSMNASFFHMHRTYWDLHYHQV